MGHLEMLSVDKQTWIELWQHMNYEDLAIQEGNQSSLEYLRMVDSSTPHKEKEEIKKALLGYCSHDTIAMVKIREELLKRF